MADVLAPTQKLDGPAPVAGPPLVDLSKLDAPKAAPAEKQVAAAPAPEGTALLASLQLTDNSQAAVTPVKDGTATPAAVDATAPVVAKVADNQPTPVAANDCDKSTACSFTPTTDREKSKPWWDARAQLVGTAPEKDANCLYTVKFGDDLSTIAQRELQAEGKAVNRDSLKAEQDKIVKLNDAQYKSLDCNQHYLQAGWRLKLTDDCTAAPAPVPVEAAPAPAPAPERKAPCPDDLPPPPPVEAAPLPPPPPVERPPCNDALPPPPPLERRQPCDDVYNSAPIQGDYQREQHMYLPYGHHVFLEHNGRRNQYDIPPGQSIIYDDNGRQRMITACNEDGSYPRHSQIIYEIDRDGRRYRLNDDQQQGFFQRFAPEFMPDYRGGYRDNGYPIQDRYSIEEHRANEQRRIHDDEARRVEIERAAAERHRELIQPVPPPVRVIQGTTNTPMTVQQIEALKTSEERTQARATAAEAIRHQQDADKLAKQNAPRPTVREQVQPQPNAAELQQRQADLARKQHDAAEAARVQAEATRRVAPPPPPPPVRQQPVATAPAKPATATAAARVTAIP
ncbi:MAG: LysM peptidoglycan-binding domain-containing protein [Candidatus Obscuribacterales bacterium]|nr:LysM peptidoglycan-binding domain-containing protein [Candidatus Obscuribacterales bacterium]